MNSIKNEKFLQINRKNLFLKLEDSKTNINNDINNINKVNYSNSKTYNDYYWRLNLKSSNFQNKTNEEILNNDLNTPEKIDNKNNLIEKKVNNSSNDNLLNNESPNKNNNNKELMTSEDNNMKVKQFLDNDNRIEKEEDLIPNISAIENKNSTIKIDSSKKENLIENNNIDNKENIDSNIKRKYLIHEPNILNSTKIQALKQKISHRNNKKVNENEDKMKQPSFIKDNNFVNFNTNNNIKNKLNTIRTKIMNNNRFENINDGERTSRLTYVGLKRYQNLSLSNLTQFQKGFSVFYMTDDNLTKINNLKRKINNLTNVDIRMKLIKSKNFMIFLKKIRVLKTYLRH